MIDDGPRLPKDLDTSDVYSRLWKRDCLSSLSGFLPTERQEELDALVAEFGAPETDAHRIDQHVEDRPDPAR